jgi:cell division septum initiation protein DivIVA
VRQIARGFDNGAKAWQNIRGTSPGDSNVNAALEILTRERETLSEQMRALKARVRELDDAIQVLSASASDLSTSHASTSGGDLAARVIAILERYHPVGIAAKEVVGMLKNEGRPTSFASLTSTLSRLKRTGRVRNEMGHWFVAANGASEVSASEALIGSAQQPIEDGDPLLEADAEKEAGMMRRTPFVIASDTRF